MSSDLPGDRRKTSARTPAVEALIPEIAPESPILHVGDPPSEFADEIRSFRYLFLNHPLPMWVYDLETLRFLEVNDAAVDHYGFSRAEFLGMKITDVRPPEEVPRLLSVVNAMRNNFQRAGEWIHRKKDGTFCIVEISSHKVNFSGRNAIFVAAHDVTDRKRTEDALRESEKRWRLVFERNLAGVYRSTLGGRVLDANESCAKILGFRDVEDLMSYPASRAYADPSERDAVIERLKQTGQLTNAEVRLQKKDGSPVWVLANMTLSSSEEFMDGVIEGTIIDITEKKVAEEQIVYRAYHDSLTGLPNRALFKERLWVMLNHAKRHELSLAVLLVDLDRFKLINDTMGHSAGDALIREAAARLQRCVTDEGLLARAGGDEFALLIPDVEHAEDAARVAESVLAQMQEPFIISGNAFYVSASIGISLYPNDGTDAETLLKSADAAVFHAKHVGRNNYQLCRPELTRRALELLSLENGLRRAIDNKEFIVYYQPQFDLTAGKFVGAEALVRWKRTDGALIEPSQFIAVAEDTHLIVPIGDTILKNACEQAASWHRRGHKLRLAVNLSAHQFHRRDLPTIVAAVLRETGLRAEYLDLEITETTAMHDVQLTIDVLHRLRAMGVRISMDDFGSGHSSLKNLKRFPLDIIKIDQTFVHDIGTDSTSNAIISAIVAMAHALGLRVIAEGVETEAQRQLLLHEGCEEIQGFLISRPLAADAFERLLES
jgi:diguanylate cyclase (GGDEF)-like protein/PAS domain S-box-containing protein